MDRFIYKHSLFWRDKEIRRHMLLSVFLLLVGLCLIYIARNYTSDYVGNIVPDLLLDTIPVFNVGIIFFQGAFLFILALGGILLWEPRYIPFTLEASALFALTRSFFMIMTHLSAPTTLYYSFFEHEHHMREAVFTVSSGNDLFFSGHAGYPFLLAFVFWQWEKARYFFLICSLIGSVAVIVGHLHYSIDVFSAYFIAFGIFEIAKKIFKKEYGLTQGSY
jgi:hypothetical protein